MDGVGQGNGPRHLAFGVMVAANEENRDIGPGKSGDLAIEEQPDARVLPFTVVKIARKKDESNALLDCDRNQVYKGVAIGLGEALRNRFILV